MSRIEPHELPARMRLVAAELANVGAAISYYGGFGPFGEWGRLLTEQTSPMMLEIADHLQKMQVGGSA